MPHMKKKVIMALPVLVILGVGLAYFLFPGAVFKILRNLERHVAGLEQKHIQVGDWHIAYLAGGKGETLLLLHGFGANKDNWTRVAKYLTPHFQVIAPDLTGFGQSSRPVNADYTVKAQVARLDRFVSALGIERLHLGGNSMGGAIAGAYAARYRHKVSSLWLIAPGGVYSAQPSELAKNLEAGQRNLLIAETPADYDRLIDFVFVQKPYIPGAIKKHFVQEAIHHRPLNQIIFEQILSAWNTEPLEALLKDLPVQALILWGDRDRVLHVSGANILNSIMPKATKVIMKNVGHVPMLEKPEASAHYYLDFLGKHRR